MLNNYIITKYYFSEEFLDKFQNILDWCNISFSQLLSEEFIEKHEDKVNWYYISCCQMLSEEFKQKHKL